MNYEALSAALARLAAGSPPEGDAGLFGMRPAPSDCALVLIPVPWDATVSYGAGTAAGPAAMEAASHQLDLEDECFGPSYKAGIALLEADPIICDLAPTARAEAEKVLAAFAAGTATPSAAVEAVNAASHAVNRSVATTAETWLAQDKIVGVVGGDHSSPYGLIAALAKRHPEGFGILHVDAHMDLRVAYEGFTHSHASIMYNVTHDLPAVTQLVQMGVRDFSYDERAYAASLGARAHVHSSRELFRRKARGENWGQIVRDVIAPLPAKVYISFDIDGLEAPLCPGTGTPVPGGLSYEEAIFLVEELAASGKRIIGFDLCEVAPGASGEWDANVGARVLYKLCGAALKSQARLGK